MGGSRFTGKHGVCMFLLTPPPGVCVCVLNAFIPPEPRVSPDEAGIGDELLTRLPQEPIISNLTGAEPLPTPLESSFVRDPIRASSACGGKSGDFFFGAT